ncbi:hypothetical protein P691DRAFT_786666 [Macrolepiota fuliginosa MF-IS2]|uniref:Uncharacterized protein n=1 Tax=Macrolepiota fuliginosa MF-IS2 TaxID=1400762 RepID=A0A9P5WVP3_9AGAR|nr:hypothetical protein P691DRAFT_786666 [Macrolepiota fuliginosa MF-IS2]
MDNLKAEGNHCSGVCEGNTTYVELLVDIIAWGSVGGFCDVLIAIYMFYFPLNAIHAAFETTIMGTLENPGISYKNQMTIAGNRNFNSCNGHWLYCPVDFWGLRIQLVYDSQPFS